MLRYIITAVIALSLVITTSNVINKSRNIKVKKEYKISEAELEVMKVIWEKSPITAKEVVEKITVENAQDWQPETIKTLINRLLKKKIINFKIRSKHYLYYPKVAKDKILQKESQSFLNRYFSGSLPVMVMNFIEQMDLSEEEIKELKNKLKEK